MIGSELVFLLTFNFHDEQILFNSKKYIEITSMELFNSSLMLMLTGRLKLTLVEGSSLKWADPSSEGSTNDSRTRTSLHNKSFSSDTCGKTSKWTTSCRSVNSSKLSSETERTFEAFRNHSKEKSFIFRKILYQQFIVIKLIFLINNSRIFLGIRKYCLDKFLNLI